MAKLVMVVQCHHQVWMMLVIILQLCGIFLIDLFPILFCLETMELIIIILIVFFVLSRLLVILGIRCMRQRNGPGPRLKVVPLLLL